MASREQKVALGRKQLSKFQQKKRDSASAPQASNSNNNNNDQPEIQPVLEPAESDSPTAVPLAESPSLTTIDAISPEARYYSI